MKKKKLLACLLAGAMVLSMAACGDDSTGSSSDPGSSDQVSSEADSTPEPAPAAKEASIDFEDGNMGFTAVYSQKANAAAVDLSVVDFNGSKALQVKFTRDGSKVVPYVAIDATSLLGADVAKVAKVEMDIAVAYENGGFSAVSGRIYAWSGADLVESSDDWSVYIASKNPNTATGTLSAGEEFVAGAGNIFIVSLETDSGVNEGNGNATMYIDNIRFLDASGNVLKADSSVAFAAPEGFESSGVDRSNLASLTGAVNFDGFATSAGAWSQAGLDMPQEFIDALVPGSVIEIEYSSTSGDLWVLMNGAEAGWIRVGQGTVDGTDPADAQWAYRNNSNTTAQVTFEQLAAAYGEDVATWGASMQCESSGDWEVYSVKVGQRAPRYQLGSDAVEFEGFATSGGAWSQAGFDMPQEFIDALVPGSVIEISYTSTSGDMWMLLNAAEAGWIRVGQGTVDGTAPEDAQYAVSDGSKSYITYEMLENAYGEDKATWGTSFQCESSGDWEVYSVKVGPARSFKMLSNPVEFEGFATSGGAWSQAGFDMPQEIIDALVPGSVVQISYTSTSGDLWVLLNAAEAGWIRVGQGTVDGTAPEDAQYAVFDGNICQVTYEMFVNAYGEDKNTWGTSMQCESSGDWEVYSVVVGQSPVTE